MAFGTIIAGNIVGSAFSKDKRDDRDKYVTIELEDDSDMFITFDVIESVMISKPTRVSQKKTTKGRRADNIQNDPITVSLKGTISDASISFLDRGKGGIGLLGLATTSLGIDPLVAGLAAEAAAALDTTPKASQVAYDMLDSIRNKKSTVKISTRRQIFEGMVIQTLDDTTTVETGRAIDISITAIQVPFVTSEEVSFSIDETLAGTAAGADTTDMGNVPLKSTSILSEIGSQISATAAAVTSALGGG